MTDEYRYDEPALVAELSHLDRRRQAAFAAACAERLMTVYERIRRAADQAEPATLRLAVDAVWAHLEGDEELRAHEYRETVEALTPGESANWSVETGLAENAVASVGYAIDTARDGDPQDAAWAARQAYEAADLWVRTRDDVDFNVEGAEERVLADPIVQTELRRQQRDLTELIERTDRSATAMATHLRTRAAVEANAIVEQEQ